jgi:hypothetical protein
MRPCDIGLGAALPRLATPYDVTELTTAAKPTLLRWRPGESGRSLRPGGILILKTVNPACMRAPRTFRLDPSHRTSLFPLVAASLRAEAGFQRATSLSLNRFDDIADRREQGECAAIAAAPQASEE